MCSTNYTLICHSFDQLEESLSKSFKLQIFSISMSGSLQELPNEVFQQPWVISLGVFKTSSSLKCPQSTLGWEKFCFTEGFFQRRADFLKFVFNLLLNPPSAPPPKHMVFIWLQIRKTNNLQMYIWDFKKQIDLHDSRSTFLMVCVNDAAVVETKMVQFT